VNLTLRHAPTWMPWSPQGEDGNDEPRFYLQPLATCCRTSLFAHVQVLLAKVTTQQHPQSEVFSKQPSIQR
jgi:hypothetical protein